MDHFIAGPAAEKFLSIFREFQAVEGFIEIRAGYHLGGLKIHHLNLVVAITRVKNRGKPSARVDSYVDGKIRQLNLLPGRTQGPLIWQQNRTVRLLPGPDRVRA